MEHIATPAHPADEPGERYRDLVAHGEVIRATGQRRPIEIETLVCGDLSRCLEEMRNDRCPASTRPR